MYVVSRLSEFSSPYYARKRLALFLCGLSMFTYFPRSQNGFPIKRGVSEGVSAIVLPLGTCCSKPSKLTLRACLPACLPAVLVVFALLCSYDSITHRRVVRRRGCPEAAAYSLQRCVHGVENDFFIQLCTYTLCRCVSQRFTAYY